jgi:PLP dependent protein
VSDLESIPERLAAIRTRIDEATQRANRVRGSVQLVAVSKTKSAAAIRAAYAAGQRDFGENYVQEFANKAAELADLPDLRWHFIGSLQRNKAKLATNLSHMIHTVDRDELVDALDKRAETIGKTLQILIEVNVGDESSKSGCGIDAFPALLERALRASHLQVRGLMAIPPFFDDSEAVRPFFSKLRHVRDAYGGAASLPELSMGMSHDFAVAIAEGATLVRVGTAIFGSR